MHEHKSSRSRRYRLRQRLGPVRPRGNPRVAVPSFFTLMNLFCGFTSITQVYQGQLTAACYLIILAGFFDLLDGIMARLTRGQSLFGVELDSLSDIVSFGVAPSTLVYALIIEETGTLGLIVAALPALCAAVRLARFNVQFDGKKADYFIGMPAPVQAYFIVAVVLNVEHNAWLARAGVLTIESIIPAVVVLAMLMVSFIRFDGVPRRLRRYMRQHPLATAAYVASGVLFGFFQYLGLLTALVVYVLAGMLRAIRTVITAPTEED